MLSFFIFLLEITMTKKALNEVNVILGEFFLISNTFKYSISSDLKIESFTKYDKEKKTSNFWNMKKCL